MQSFFLIFFNLQKIAPQIAKKADNTNPHPPHDTPPQRKYGSHRAYQDTWTPGTAGHPGLLILYRVRLLILDCSSGGHSSRQPLILDH